MVVWRARVIAQRVAGSWVSRAGSGDGLTVLLVAAVSLIAIVAGSVALLNSGILAAVANTATKVGP